MALFWLVSERDGEQRVFIQDTSSSLNARIRAAMADLKQVFFTVQELNARAAKKVPRRATGPRAVG